ncbi:MAG: outer membrane lipoprotein-sorting protein [Candidatus Omnitrophica bacterium]|nr:outer membrane lipoprotein-sorting protein [Candidatus Omnitrophota bacterium]MCB9719763.1 outer membrane lipoprotein-sorting protein [Candidatus Omnitrophota bacterium]
MPEVTPRIENAPPTAGTEPEPVVVPPRAPAKEEKTAPADTVVAPRPEAREIVKKSDDLMRGDTAQGIYIMEITTPSWTRTLELSVFSKGRDRVFIRILSPAKEADTGTLRLDNEMWNFLPRIEKVIKIPPSMMLQSWMGSDFANDDLVKENSIVEDYTHRIVAEETLNGHATYKIELIPKPGAAVIWGRLDYWIRRADFVPIRQDFYDERGRMVKRLDYSDIEQVSDRTVPRTWLMTNLLKDGKSTRIYLKDVVYNQPIDDNIFTLSNLKRLK